MTYSYITLQNTVNDYRFDPFTGATSPIPRTDYLRVPLFAPYVVSLPEVPHQAAPSVTLVATPGGFQEVACIPGPLEYRVDYKYRTGSVQFNSAQAGVVVGISYLGLGSALTADVLNAQSLQDPAQSFSRGFWQHSVLEDHFVGCTTGATTLDFNPRPDVWDVWSTNVYMSREDHYCVVGGTAGISYLASRPALPSGCSGPSVHPGLNFQAGVRIPLIGAMDFKIGVGSIQATSPYIVGFTGFGKGTTVGQIALYIADVIVSDNFMPVAVACPPSWNGVNTVSGYATFTLWAGAKNNWLRASVTYEDNSQTLLSSRAVAIYNLGARAVFTIIQTTAISGASINLLVDFVRFGTQGEAYNA